MLVQSAFKVGDTIIHSKRMSYSRAKLLQVNINHRRIEKNEIVFDVDAKSLSDSHYIMDKISARLCVDEYSHKVYLTGNKGHHIHLVIPELSDYRLSKRKMARRMFLNYYADEFTDSIDFHKVSDKVMIRMENSKHEATGKYKRCTYEANYDKENELPEWIKNVVEGIEEPKRVEYDVNWMAGNRVLNWCMNNKIPEGNRNIWLMKNVAVLIMKLNLQDRAKCMVDKIHKNMGEKRNDIHGWIKYFEKKGSAHYNQREVDKWFKVHQIKLQ